MPTAAFERTWLARCRRPLRRRPRDPRAYNAAAEGSAGDAHGKSLFRHAPVAADGVFYVGRIVPVLHYTMGGLRMDTEGRVLRADGAPIPRLSAAGEVTGGVHGHNRLGGNSLLECAVFGSIVGKRLPILSQEVAAAAAAAEQQQQQQQQARRRRRRPAPPRTPPARRRRSRSGGAWGSRSSRRTRARRAAG